MQTDPGLARVAAFQLLARFPLYSDLISELAERWPNEEAYARTSTLVNVIGSEAMAIPELRAPWVEVLLSHTNLIQQFWAFSDASTRLDAAEAHIDVFLSFEAKCLQVATGKQVLL